MSQAQSRGTDGLQADARMAFGDSRSVARADPVCAHRRDTRRLTGVKYLNFGSRRSVVVSAS